MKSMLSMASMIISLIYSSDGFATNICVKGPWGWLSSLDGEYEYQSMVNGHPAYTQISCTSKPDDCDIKRTLSVKTTYYIFTDDNGGESAFCMDEKTQYPLEGIDSPELCPAWWGWSGDTSHIVRDCDITTTLSPELKSVEHNLINPYPECYYGKDQEHFCQEIYSQSANQQDVTHPNYEERLTATLINMARLFPDYYLYDSKYGAPNHKYDTEGYCGKAASTPLFYNQKANEATRFHQYDQMYCNGDKGHTTCNDPDRCSLFKHYGPESEECAAATRWTAFEAMKPDDNIVISSEGICGRDGCYIDGHCSAMFDPSHDMIGIGKWKGSYSYDAVYVHGNNKKYPIVYGAHLDGRYYWNYNLPDTFEKITFLLQWYGVNYGKIRANSVYLLYENDEHSMKLLQGDNLSGFYEIEFEMNSDDNKHFCEPYAFIVEASDGNTYRLPENDRYFFGTAFFDSYNDAPLYECNENHYYKNDNNQWMANDGPLNLITSNNGCIGCSKANNLEALNNIDHYDECPGSDAHCHSVNGHLKCDDGYITSCSTPLTSNCNSACNAIINNGFAANFQAWV